MPKFDPRGNYEDTGGGRKVARDGEHIFVVSIATLGRSKNKNKMISVEAKVVDKEDPSRGCMVREWFVLDPSWYGKLKDFTDAINPNMPGPADPDGFDAERQASIDEHIERKLFAGTTYTESEEYKGRPTKKARFDRYGWRALTDAERERISLQYDGGVPAARKAAPADDPFDAPPPPDDSDFGGEFLDDEIPF